MRFDKANVLMWAWVSVGIFYLISIVIVLTEDQIVNKWFYVFLPFICFIMFNLFDWLFYSNRRENKKQNKRRKR